jgi:hypothetical protein
VSFLLSAFQSFCLSVFLSFSLFVFQSFCLSVFLSFSLFVFQYFCLPIFSSYVFSLIFRFNLFPVCFEVNRSTTTTATNTSTVNTIQECQLSCLIKKAVTLGLTHCSLSTTPTTARFTPPCLTQLPFLVHLLVIRYSLCLDPKYV